MTPIRYITGDATDPQAAGPKIVAHCCNDLGRWGKGFVMAVSARWPEPEEDFKAWARLGTAGGFVLGAVRFVEVRADILVANMIGQHGIKKGSNGPPIRYQAIASALTAVGNKALELGASVHLPRIGCGLAGGKWEKVEPLILEALSERGIEVTVYDFGG